MRPIAHLRPKRANAAALLPRRFTTNRKPSELFRGALSVGTAAHTGPHRRRPGRSGLRCGRCGGHRCGRLFDRGASLRCRFLLRPSSPLFFATFLGAFLGAAFIVFFLRAGAAFFLTAFFFVALFFTFFAIIVLPFMTASGESGRPQSGTALRRNDLRYAAKQNPLSLLLRRDAPSNASGAPELAAGTAPRWPSRSTQQCER